MAGVNLLQSAIATPGRARRGVAGRRGAVAGWAVAAMTIGVLAPWWWGLHREAARVERELAGLGQRTARVRLRAANADRLARTAASLERRIQAVADVQRTRGERLRVLTAVTDTLPEGCWLSGLIDDGSGAVRIEGRAADVSSVVEFVRGLVSTGAFGGGVDVLDSHAATATAPEGESVAFVLRAWLAPAGSRGRAPGSPPRPASPAPG